MWFLWLLIGLILGGVGGWAYSTFVLGRATGQLLVDAAVQRALIKVLVAACEEALIDLQAMAGDYNDPLSTIDLVEAALALAKGDDGQD